MLTSTHKIAGSLTQSAMLHVGNSRPRRSTSARSPARCGCCARRARRRCCSPRSTARAGSSSLHGEQLLHETLEAIDVARAKLETIPGIALVDASLVGRMGVAGYDPLRIVARRARHRPHRLRDRRRAAPLLRRPPRAADAGDARVRRRARRVGGRRCGGWPATSTRSSSALARAGRDGADRRRPPTSLRNEVAVPPREAFLGEAEQVAVDDAVGRISCESIASYPPGVPALLPGERISAETVAYLRELAASGARLHGASDPAFQTINVLREERMIDPLERWAAVRREARLRGPADLRRRALHPGPGRAARLRRRDRRRADGRPRLRPPRARASRRARSARRAARPGRTSRSSVDAFAALRIVDFGDAPVHPGRPAAHRTQAIEATSARCSPPARSRSSSAATTRSPSRRCARARPSTGRSG